MLALTTEASNKKRLLDEADQAVEQLRQELLSELDGHLLSADEPFLGGFTLGQALVLSEAERAKLWEEWSEIVLEDIEEVEIRPNALLDDEQTTRKNFKCYFRNPGSENVEVAADRIPLRSVWGKIH